MIAIAVIGISMIAAAIAFWAVDRRSADHGGDPWWLSCLRYEDLRLNDDDRGTVDPGGRGGVQTTAPVMYDDGQRRTVGPMFTPYTYQDQDMGTDGQFRLGRGPLIYEDGKPVPVFWVACCGCGGQYPMVENGGRHYPPDFMNRIGPLGEDDEFCGPIFYATPDCTENAALMLKDEFETSKVAVLVTHPTDHINLDIDPTRVDI